MATIKISDLPDGADTLSANDMFPIVDAGTNTTKKVTLQNLENYIQAEHQIDLFEDRLDSDEAAIAALQSDKADITYVDSQITAVAAYDEYSTTSTVLNTNVDVYNNNGLGGATGRGTDDPNGEGGWHWESPGDTGSQDHHIGWRVFNNDGPQTFSVNNIEYMYMIVDIYADGEFYFNLYTAGLNPAPSAFRSRFTFAPTGGNWGGQTGLCMVWAKPPGSNVTESDVDAYPFLPRIEVPYQVANSSGDLDVTEVIKSLNITTSTSAGEGDVQFTVKNVGYKVDTGYIQNFDMICSPDDKIAAAIGPVAQNDEYATTSTVLNTNEDVYNNNGFGGATARATDDPNGEGGWYFRSPGDQGGNDHYIGWRLFNNDGPQTFTVEDIEYMYMVAEIYADGQFYFNVYTAGLNPAPSAFRSRFTFNPTGSNWDGQTGLYLIWAKPPGSTTAEADVDIFPFLPRIEMPYNAGASSGDLVTDETIKSLNILTNTSAGAGDVEFSVKNAGYKVKTGYVQNFDFIVAPDDKIANFDASQFDFTNLPTAPTTAGMLYRDSDVIKVTL